MTEKIDRNFRLPSLNLIIISIQIVISDVVPLTEDKYIVFLSGIELGSDSNSTLMKLQMFIDFLNGDFLNADHDNCDDSDGEKTDYEKRMEHILSNTSRCIIVGNCLASNTQSKGMHKQAKYLQKNFVAGSVNPIKQLDEFLLQLTGIEIGSNQT